tara:strand:- start:1822 stop:2331 length:510 start_codon:yes stop_codon:yes gene_type:complete
MFNPKNIFKIFFMFSLYGTISNPVYSQIAGIERRFGTSNTNTFSYQIESTIGTRTSATVSGNILAETDAILNLKTGSKISNKIGDENGNASAVFIATPNGANVDLSGITGENLFMIEDGTQFKSSLRMKENFNDNVQSIGEASSFAVQNTRVTVQKTNSSLINSFQQAF